MRGWLSFQTSLTTVLSGMHALDLIFRLFLTYNPRLHRLPPFILLTTHLLCYLFLMFQASRRDKHHTIHPTWNIVHVKKATNTVKRVQTIALLPQGPPPSYPIEASRRWSRPLLR